MKKNFKFLICLFALLIGFESYSQNLVRTPFILDSTNNKGEKFNVNSFLNIPSLEELRTKDKYKYVNEGELVSIESPKENSFKLITYITYIYTEDFTKTTINLYSNDKVKIALNGKMIKERLKIVDSLNNDSKISHEISLEPGKHILSFSFLVSNENTTHDFRFEFENKENIIINKDRKFGLSLNEMLEGRNIYSASISPSGKYILIKYFDLNEKGKRNYGYTVSDNNKTLFSDEGNTSIAWAEKGVFFNSNDEDILYFFDNSGENKRLIKQNLYGQKTIMYENLPEGSINILNNKTPFAIISQSNKIDNSKEDLRQYILPDDRIDGWRTRSLLSLYNFETNQIQPLTYGYLSTYINDYNPKTNSIIFSVSYSNITKRPFRETSIFEMNLDDFSVDTIINRDGFASSASYIPNTNKLILRGSGEAFGGIGNTLKKGIIPNPYHSMLFIMNRDNGKIECITKDFNPSVSNLKISNSNSIFFSAENKDSISIYKYDLNNNEIVKLDLPLDIVSGFDIDFQGNSIAYFGQNYNDFPKAYIRTDNKDYMILQPKSKEELAIGEMRVWNFNYKGTTIEGRYYLPSDFDANKKYPMIVYYYAGTTPTDRSFEMRYSAYLYTSQGYIVYVLNPSGTIGYGQEFASRHVNAWGERTADEIIFGVKKFISENSFVDKDKIGCMGASYGGFMTQLLQTKTDIFACAVSHAGISDITSYWGEGYWGYSYSSGATAHSYPWNRRDIYVDRSPLFNADKINTPLLLLHGDSDTNVPIGESIQMFNALKILGKEVEFISVKGENHGIVDFEKRLKWNNTIYAWFAKHLKNNSKWWDTLYPEKKL